ncbi:MAG TPA: flagellar motor protein MotB, partial [Solibacterales bacterium]|nr:flagellar motor protein MotB [Bryobacterales bacterium]
MPPPIRPPPPPPPKPPPPPPVPAPEELLDAELLDRAPELLDRAAEEEDVENRLVAPRKPVLARAAVP